MPEEYNIKWHFGAETARPTGPNDSATQFFNDYPVESLVRESIQNSLDQKNPNNDDPVMVIFEFGGMASLSAPDLPEESKSFFNPINSLMSIKEHILECKEYWNSRILGLGDEYTRNMLKCFDDLNPSSTFINWIEVSDYNTKGMDYRDSSLGASRFYGFVTSKGVHYQDGQGTGGSFGIGKHAYYGMSQIRTVLTSSKCIENNSDVFMGVSLLTTHKHNGIEVTNEGFFTDNQNRIPITDTENIPIFFKRNEVGTDMYIIGYDPDRELEYVKRIKEAVLRNFWPAIYYNKLIVKINSHMTETRETIIDAQSLQAHIEQTFSGIKDSTRKFHMYNVLPYFDAVRFGELNNEQYKMEIGEIEGLGTVKFYATFDPEASGKIIYMRKPLMVVYRDKKNVNVKYAGVFICDDNNGDKLLVQAEGPAHREWKKIEGRDRAEEVEVALQQIELFIDDCFKKWFPERDVEETDMYGSDAYISIMQEDDDLPEDRISKNQLGLESRHTSTLETGNIKTCVNNKRRSKAKRRKKTRQTISSEQGDFQRNEYGQDIIHPEPDNTNPEQNPGPIHSSNRPIIDIHKGDFTQNLTESYKSIERSVNLSRVIAHLAPNGNVHHTLIFDSKIEVADAKLQFVIFGEDSDAKGEFIEIKNAIFNGQDVPLQSICKDSVKHLKIDKGRNRIELEFYDNIKYNVDLMPYELK